MPTVVASHSKRGVTFGARGGVRTLGGAHLGVGGFQVRSLLECLCQRVFQRQRRGGREGHFVGDIVLIVWRQANHAREIDFLLRQIVL